MLTLPERLLLISIDQRGSPRDPKSCWGMPSSAPP
jgi:hypothetical protein